MTLYAGGRGESRFVFGGAILSLNVCFAVNAWCNTQRLLNGKPLREMLAVACRLAASAM